MPLPYRNNVAAFIVNDKKEILTCKRADKFEDWQLPQGGIDDNETPIEALRRELLEEVYLKDFSIIFELPIPITYDWPQELHSRGFKGQRQYFFVASPTEKHWNPDFTTHHLIEFKEYSWSTKSEFINLVTGSFRAKSYLTALEEIQKINPEMF